PRRGDRAPAPGQPRQAPRAHRRDERRDPREPTPARPPGLPRRAAAGERGGLVTCPGCGAEVERISSAAVPWAAGVETTVAHHHAAGGACITRDFEPRDMTACPVARSAIPVNGHGGGFGSGT